VKRFIVAIDQGTTSSRAILFNISGVPEYSSQKEFNQYFPKDGWVEHNPNEIWSTTKKVLKDVINKSKKPFKKNYFEKFNNDEHSGKKKFRFKKYSRRGRNRAF